MYLKNYIYNFNSTFIGNRRYLDDERFLITKKHTQNNKLTCRSTQQRVNSFNIHDLRYL